MYQCPNCTGNLKYDIRKKKLYCEYCGTTVDPYEFHKEKDAEEHTSEEYEVTVFTCPQCGGEIMSEDTTAATFCSFCGSATILDSRISKARRPGYIIPFAKTKEDCKEAYGKMMAKAFFAPKELKNKEHIEKFRGIYMPYWVYSFEQQGKLSLKGKTESRRGDYRITRHYQLDCEIDQAYKGISFDAASSFSDTLSRSIAPFDMKKGQEFAPTFLSGFYADTNDVGSGIYEKDAEDIVLDYACTRVMNNPTCKRYGVGQGSYYGSLKGQLRPNVKNATLAMLPVWFLTYRKDDRVCYAVVNGQTGKVAADLPIDFKKYLLFSGILAVPLFILLNLFFTITPTRILWIAAILALVCFIISNVQLNRIIARETGEDDKGMQALLEKQRRQKGKSKAAESSADLGQMMAEGREKAAQERGKKNSQGRKNGLIIIALVMVVMWILPLLFLTSSGRMMTSTGTISISFDLVSLFGKGMIVFTVGMVLWPIISAFIKNKKKKRGGKGLFSNFKLKFETLVKPLAAIILAIAILIIDPVRDEFYYFGAFACMVAIILAVLDIVEQHNQLTTRKLPQFNARGGDENA